MGENLFGLQHQRYPKLDQTKKELAYLTQLYSLYLDVLDTIKEWTEYPWLEVPEHMEDMTKMVDQFAARCKKMPRNLREWPAYNELKTTLEDFQVVLPLPTLRPGFIPRPAMPSGSRIFGLGVLRFQLLLESMKVGRPHWE